MSANEERTLILKMLQEGKITAEEAEKLLDAIESNIYRDASEGPQSQRAQYQRTQSQRAQANFQDEVQKMRERVNNWRKEFKTSYANSDFDRAVEEFAAKAEKAGKNLANTTAGIVDKVIDFVSSFIDNSSFNVFGSYKTVEKNFEAPAVEGSNIYIQGVNGYIILRKHIDDKIVIKTKLKAPQNNADEILSFNDTGNLVELRLNKTSNISVSHEVFLPATCFGGIKIDTTNGKIYAEDSNSKFFEAVTRNSNIELMGVNSEKISVNTKNGKILLSYVIGRNIDINTTNSIIDVKHIKVENMNAFTINGRIVIENIQNYEGQPEITLKLKTSNGGIKVNMNDIDNRGYKVRAKTTNAGINILIPEMIYHNANTQSFKRGGFVEAENIGYENFPERVFIDAETVNGYIEIVK